MSERSLHTEPSIVDRLKTLDLALTRAMAAALKGEAVTASQAGVLLFLAQRHGESIPNRRIEEFFGISNPAASSMVKRLEPKGLVATSINPDDKRCYCVEITDYGYKCMVAADEKAMRLDEQILDGLSPKEANLALKFVERMTANLLPREQ